MSSPARSSLLAAAVLSTVLGGCGGDSKPSNSATSSRSATTSPATTTTQRAATPAGPRAPDVVGLDVTEARQRLTAKGLRLGAAPATPGCLVVTQKPAPRAPLPASRAVTVETNCGSSETAGRVVSQTTYRVPGDVWSTYDREVRLAAARVFVKFNPNDCRGAKPEALVRYVDARVATAKQPVNKIMLAGCPAVASSRR